jgi:peptide/nickel transport system substrate-binding protein
MGQHLRAAVTPSALLIAISVGGTASAQKAGGILRMDLRDNLPSLSILEESDFVQAMMGIFNNLVLFDQHVAQNSLGSIVPDLATRWSWSEDGTELTFPLRQGIRWHDGKPFTAADVKCTWDLLTGKSSERLRLDPRQAWYRNLEGVTTNGDCEVTFHLKRPQPAFLVLLASGWSAVYPCHMPPAQMRHHPIGTGPFKLGEFKPNERVTLVRNEDYWKPDRPYLDGIEFTLIREVSTKNLAFVAGKLDVIGLAIPQLKDVKSQAPQAICEVQPGGFSRNLIINRDAPPFDNPELRRAIALSLDRKAFIDIINEGQGDVGGAMQPLPEGLWGMPPEVLHEMPGYDPDVQKNRVAARQIMQKLGYGPDNPLAVKLATRNDPLYRNPAVIMIDQLKEIGINAELDVIDTRWFPKVMRKDYMLGLNATAAGVDDPDQQFYENYACGSPRNFTGYCNRELDQLFDRQSVEADQERRKKLVWEIERRLAEDVARPIIFWGRGARCRQPYVKAMTVMVNGTFNGWPMEDIWLDK